MKSLKEYLNNTDLNEKKQEELPVPNNKRMSYYVTDYGDICLTSNGKFLGSIIVATDAFFIPNTKSVPFTKDMIHSIGVCIDNAEILQKEYTEKFSVTYK